MPRFGVAVITTHYQHLENERFLSYWFVYCAIVIKVIEISAGELSTFTLLQTCLEP